MGKLTDKDVNPYSPSSSPVLQQDQGRCSQKHAGSEPRSSPSTGFSFGERSRLSQTQDDKRGPGAYMSIWEQSQGPAYSFSVSKNPDRRKECDGPGPGQYCSGVGYYATKSSAPAYSMGARCGPSAFFRSDPEMSAGVQGRVRCGVAFSTPYTPGKNFSLIPGPGSYNTSSMPRGPSYSMGTKKSDKRGNRNESPGPGAYDVTRKTSGPSFSIAPKMRSICQRDVNPGPGSYCNMSDSQNKGLSYTMRERFK